jgi:RimJ/RimL family protein N-acetyltransferase
MDPFIIEESSLAAWPALQQECYDGWILRYSMGYTKRSNSVNPIYPSSKDLNEKADYCEKWYQGKGLPTIFRITPFVSPQHLDPFLDARGYKKIDVTSVLTLQLSDLQIQPRPGIELRTINMGEWLQIYHRFKEETLQSQMLHRKILEAIPFKVRFVILLDAGHPVACGIGVVDKPIIGLFNLITIATQRKKGYGTDLLVSLLDWARGIEVELAYLQVVENNVAAMNLYAKCDFKKAYSYWYRVKVYTEGNRIS